VIRQVELFLAVTAHTSRREENGAKKRHHCSPRNVDIKGRLDDACRGRAQAAISDKESTHEQEQKSNGESNVEIQEHLLLGSLIDRL
jgi:hypothetical protein